MNTAFAELSFHRAADLQAFGMPEDRLARMAARRAFVEMKTCFMHAVAEIEGSTGALLQRKVRMAGSPFCKAALAERVAHINTRQTKHQVTSTFQRSRL